MNSNSPMKFRERADFEAQAGSLLYRRLAVGKGRIFETFLFSTEMHVLSRGWPIAVA
jgi:hypothetical protein